MANSKLLKEAIADAKAVKETALANAKLALEEAFTPRLQSILSQKMRAEAEMEDDEAEKVDEELSSDGIGSKVDAGYAETPGANPTLTAQTDLSVGVKKDGGKPEQAGTDYKKVADISEEENPFADKEDDKDAEIAELKARLAELEGNDSDEMHDEPDMDNMGGESDMDADNADEKMGDDSMDMYSKDDESEDDMDLEAIIRELEAQLGDDDSDDEEGMYEAEEDEEKVDEAEETEKEKDATNEAEEDDKKDDVIDLEEILREMEADMKDDKEKVDEAEEEEKEKELNEAYKTIKSLQKTINEVNLLNAKLLFANKLFRAHNMTNEQKVKVIETLDRTNSVREVKLVYSTLAENFKYTSISKTAKKSITEGIASKVVKSTAPKAAVKQVIAESAQISDRFKKLAGIIK